MLALFAALSMAGCSEEANSGSLSGDSQSSSTSVTLAEALTFGHGFTMYSSALGSFSLTFVGGSHEFLAELPEESYGNFTFGAAFEGFEIYMAGLDTEDGQFYFITSGELVTGYSYGTIKGQGITVGGEDFELSIPITPAFISAEGNYYSRKTTNSLTLSIENGSFHSDIDAEDIVLGGGLEGTTISAVTPLLSDGEEATSEELTYQSVRIDFSGESGPEQYAHITVLDSGTTYNEDLSTSIDLLKSGAELLDEIYTSLGIDTLKFAFYNLTINPEMTLSDISVTGALEGTILERMEIIEFEDYGSILTLQVIYPRTFVGGVGDTESREASFLFSENSNLEGEEVEVALLMPTPDIQATYSYDATTRKVTNTLYFSNGSFNDELTATNFAYYGYIDGEAIPVTDASVSVEGYFDENLIFSCTMSESFEPGLVYLKITDIFHVMDMVTLEETGIAHDVIEYLA